MFADCLGDKILPVFKNLDREAEKITQQEFKRLGYLADPTQFDEGDIAEMASDKGISYYLNMTGLLQGILNLFAVGAYHRFEQQLHMFYRREVLPKEQEDDFSEFGIGKIIERIKKSKIEITSFSNWPKVDELRLVANTVKHADGLSAKELKERRPDLFEPPDLGVKKIMSGPPASLRQVFQPLSGEDLFVSHEEIQSYSTAIKQFWVELANALENQ